MADFRTHISTSTIIGIGYGAAGYLQLGAPLETCALAAGLCSVSGMLPDLDSDSGVPVRETMSLAAAVVPMLMMDRFSHFGWSHETMVFAGMIMYLAIRFGVASIFKKYTVHRGMWHSIPAAASAGLLAFLVCTCDDMTMRWYKAAAVVIGFLSHLVLDELWSIDIRRGRLRFKKSFGTAMKFYSGSMWANISTYGKLALLLLAASYDPVVMREFADKTEQVERTARELIEETHEHAEQLLR
ncbi:MAG: metal-dependent hydrolase [Planctomycetaceae bacterium]|nr:metal-dependent hydrolase [Planctomycetales bacterium]MCB9927034.1 metal-dependent hydrolase [Planctomycetaceae bacterium]